MNASSSTTVKRTKQTLVLSNKPPSVDQKHNFINSTSFIRCILTMHSLLKASNFLCSRHERNEGVDGGE
jgi:hypothetical protein